MESWSTSIRLGRERDATRREREGGSANEKEGEQVCAVCGSSHLTSPHRSPLVTPSGHTLWHSPLVTHLTSSHIVIPAEAGIQACALTTGLRALHLRQQPHTAQYQRGTDCNP